MAMVAEAPHDWRDRARCLNYPDPDIFDPPDERNLVSEKNLRKARRLCALCPVRRECLMHAFSTERVHIAYRDGNRVVPYKIDEVGIRAGTTWKQRWASRIMRLADGTLTPRSPEERVAFLDEEFHELALFGPYPVCTPREWRDLE